MGLKKGKWIRIECDNSDKHMYHPNNTLDISYKTMKDANQTIAHYGFKKIKGKWYCKSCADKEQ